MTKLLPSSVSPKPAKRARVLTKPPSNKGSIGQPFTKRETEVLWLLTEGLSNKSIADRLELSSQTIKFHLKNATKKIGTSSRTKAAVDFALRQGNTARALTMAKSDSEDCTHPRDDENGAEKRGWIRGYAVALAQVHRHGGGNTVVCKATRAAGLTLATARSAGVSPLDIDELKRAKVP